MHVITPSGAMVMNICTTDAIPKHKSGWHKYNFRLTTHLISPNLSFGLMVDTQWLRAVLYACCESSCNMASLAFSLLSCKQRERERKVKQCCPTFSTGCWKGKLNYGQRQVPQQSTSS